MGGGREWCWVLYRRARWWWGGTYILYLGWVLRLRWDGWCALTLLTVREAHTVHYIHRPKPHRGKVTTATAMYLYFMTLHCHTVLHSAVLVVYRKG